MDCMPVPYPRHWLDAMSFFTCLVPARLVGRTTLAECVPWIAACGLCTGLVCTALAWVAALAAHLVWADTGWLCFAVPGLVWVAAEMAVSRGLHWDGLADMGDALGSQRCGAAFRTILKDSRLGALGALVLLVVFAAQLASAIGHVAQNQWAVLMLAPAWGRGMAVPLFCLASPYDTHSLGGQFAAGGTRRNLMLTLLYAACMLALFAWVGTSPVKLLVLCAGQALLIWRIAFWARLHNGFSGDFVGCLMELGQSLCLLACL